MAHQYLNDGEEEEVRSRPTDEPEQSEDPREDVLADEASSHVDEQVTAHAAPRRPRRNTRENQPEAQANVESEDSVISSEEADLRELEERGFTRDEATRLIDLSVRINEATIKRLQFTRWLVEQGLLDEFSVRSE
jgi:hypothetical protein